MRWFGGALKRKPRQRPGSGSAGPATRFVTPWDVLNSMASQWHSLLWPLTSTRCSCLCSARTERASGTFDRLR